MRFLLVCCLVLIQSTLTAAELRIASAANFYPTLQKITTEYAKQTGHTVTLIRGSTGKLYAQIMRGAPYDVFFSADSQRADKLVENGRSINDVAKIYAIGQLALWKPDAASAEELKQLLQSGEFKKLAVANPKTAPYGKAAIETLKSMGLYAKVKNRLVYGENISQTLQFVESGAADLGFVARSHVNAQIYFSVDNKMHQPIEQKMLVLKQSTEATVAVDFMRFMQTPEVQKIIKQDGYDL